MGWGYPPSHTIPRSVASLPRLGHRSSHPIMKTNRHLWCGVLCVCVVCRKSRKFSLLLPVIRKFDISDFRSIGPTVYRTLFNTRSIGPSVYRPLFNNRSIGSSVYRDSPNRLSPDCCVFHHSAVISISTTVHMDESGLVQFSTTRTAFSFRQSFPGTSQIRC